MTARSPVSFGDDTAAWIDAIHAAQAVPVRFVTAHTFGRDWEQNSSRPVLLTCDDGRDYVVKGPHAGRIPVNDQVIGRLGQLMSAPVPRVTLVDVPADLIGLQPEMAHMQPGLSHGSEVVQAVTESYVIEHAAARVNRARFAKLAVLWGWVSVFDRQYLYTEEDPPILYAADHGHAFPRGPEWTRRSLLNPPTPAALDHDLEEVCKFTEREIRVAAEALRGIDDAQIANAVAAPPNHWGFPNAGSSGPCAVSFSSPTGIARQSGGGQLNRKGGERDAMASRYAIFQYVPDLISGERVNFGVVAYDDSTVHVRFLQRWTRVRDFAGKDVAFLKHFAERVRESADSTLLTDVGKVTHLDHELISRMAERWIHSIQVTEPRASTLRPHTLVEQMATKVLRQAARRETAVPARRKVAQQAAISGVRAALEDVTEGHARGLLKPGGILQGELTENKFDAVVQNGTPVLAAHGISFQGQSDGHAANVVNAISFMFSDVRQKDAEIPLALVAIPPRFDISGEYERAQDICSKLNVDVVEADMVEDWARPTVQKYFAL